MIIQFQKEVQNKFFNFSKFSSHNKIRPKASSHREHNVKVTVIV